MAFSPSAVCGQTVAISLATSSSVTANTRFFVLRFALAGLAALKADAGKADLMLQQSRIRVLAPEEVSKPKAPGECCTHGRAPKQKPLHCAKARCRGFLNREGWPESGRSLELRGQIELEDLTGVVVAHADVEVLLTTKVLRAVKVHGVYQPRIETVAVCGLDAAETEAAEVPV